MYQEKPKQSSVISPKSIEIIIIGSQNISEDGQMAQFRPEFLWKSPQKKIFAPRCSIHSNRGTNIWAFSASPETPSGIRPLKTGRS